MKELASERRNTTGPVGKRRDEGGEAVSANRAPATKETHVTRSLGRTSEFIRGRKSTE